MGLPVRCQAESFTGRLRDECLNQNWFTTVNEARDIIEKWGMDHNGVRPHSSLGNLSPEEFIAETGKPLVYSGLQSEGRSKSRPLPYVHTLFSSVPICQNL